MKYRRCQVELLPLATSYIPTSGVSATRSSDFCRISWAKNLQPLQVIGNSLTTHMEFNVLGGVATSPSYRLLLSQHGSAKYHMVRIERNNNLIRLYRSGGGIGPVDTALPEYRSGYCATIVEPNNKTTLIVNDLSFSATALAHTLGTPSSLNVGCDESGSQLFGHIRNLRIWNKVLTLDQI